MEFTKSFASARGFTLIELMIAVAILAIVMGIAIPSYNQWVLESGRADAKGVLMQSAQTLERCFTRYNAYDDENCALAEDDTVTSENNKYVMTVTTLAADAFTLTAAPQGGQANDTECEDFTLNHQGRKGVSAGTDPALIDECW